MVYYFQPIIRLSPIKLSIIVEVSIFTRWRNIALKFVNSEETYLLMKKIDVTDFDIFATVAIDFTVIRVWCVE